MKIIKKIFLILNPKEKRKFLRLIFFDVIISVLDIAFLVLLLYIINFYTHPPQLSRPPFPFRIFIEYPLLPIIVFFILFTLKNFFGFLVFKMQYGFVYDVSSRISGDRLLSWLGGSYEDFVNIDSSVYTRKISQQPIEFSHYVLRGVQQIISQVILIILAIIPVLIFNPVLFPLLFLILVPPVFLISIFMKRKLTSVRAHGKSTSERAIQHLHEALAGFVESNIYGRNEFFTIRYHRFQAKLNGYLSEQQVIQNLPPRLIEIFAVFGLLVLILINHYTSTSTVQVMTIGAFMAAAYKIIPGIVKILNSTGQIKTYAFTLNDLSDGPGLTDRLKSDRDGQTREPGIKSIKFENVSFSYEKEKVLENFNLEIRQGDFIGISADSGRGKTTIINLLLGFLTPGSGEILINDSPASNGERKLFWNKIAYVKQEAFFIYDSILTNITFSENAEQDKKLAEIIAVTGIDQLVNKFPEGINTVVTENGKNFSGGQRQRILLARALYKEFDLLILDEPFNELDEEASTTLLKYIQTLPAMGKIVILISHSKEGMMYCNKKWVLE